MNIVADNASNMCHCSMCFPVLNGVIKLECHHKICKLAFVILRLAELYSIMREHN